MVVVVASIGVHVNLRTVGCQRYELLHQGTEHSRADPGLAKQRGL